MPWLTIILKILPYFKKYWREILLGILLFALVFFYYQDKSETKRANEAEKGRLAAIQIGNKYAGLSEIYKNKYGDLVTKVQVITVDRDNIKALAQERELQWLRKFAGLKKDNSNLQSAMTFGTEFQTMDVPVKIVKIPCKDSIKVWEYFYHDKYNDIRASVIDTPKFVIKDRYYAVIELARAKHWFIKGLWSKAKKWHPVAEITNANKLVKIDSAAVIQVK